MADKHGVVITGIGTITPLGNNARSNWDALLSGRSGIRQFDTPIPGAKHVYSVGCVHDEHDLLEACVPKACRRKTDRFTHLTMIASREALEDAKLNDPTSCDRERFGVYLGVGIGGLQTINEICLDFARAGARSVTPFMIPKVISNEAASWLTMTWDLRGPSLAVTNACSSGGDAVGLAFRAIRDGYADYMLAGGTESCVSPISIAAFGNMRALSTWNNDPTAASRPFDKERTGFVMAEGSGMLVLERKDLAVARGAKIYAEVAGYGATSDAFHITAMHPEGRGAKRAMRLALEEAGASPQQVGYINAHGTGTPMNDVLETKAIKEVFGAHAATDRDRHVLVSSSKSMTGHMLGAAGGAEISYTAMALREQVAPPTINLDTPDEACDLDYVTEGARAFEGEYAMSNSFGFGGGNAVVVLRKI